MPNLRDWTASEIVVQMPGARTVLTKHFGTESLRSGSGARLRDLARWKGVDLDRVVLDLDHVARGLDVKP